MLIKVVSSYTQKISSLWLILRVIFIDGILAPRRVVMDYFFTIWLVTLPFLLIHEIIPSILSCKLLDIFTKALTSSPSSSWSWNFQWLGHIIEGADIGNNPQKQALHLSSERPVIIVFAWCLYHTQIQGAFNDNVVWSPYSCCWTNPKPCYQEDKC